MKKFLTCAIAAGAVLFATTSAFAAFTVKVGTTQPTFGLKNSCERAGTITFTFPSNSVLTVGDTYSMTIQDGPLFCKTIDYVIGSSADGAVPTAGDANILTGVVFAPTTGQFGVVDAAKSGDPGVNSAVVNTVSNKAIADKMPVKASGGVAAPGVAYDNSNRIVDNTDTDTQRPIYFHVYAKNGSNKATVKVLGHAAGDAIIVGDSQNDSLEIRLFNGKQYADQIDAVDPLNIAAEGEVIDAILLPTTVQGITAPVYGAPVDDNKDADYTNDEPTEKNTICINVPESFKQTCVEFRYDSSDVVGNTVCDFSNDFSIMCFESTPYSLVPCKGFVGEIQMTTSSQQNQASCKFDYEKVGDEGYCALPSYQGNRIIIKSNKSTFAPTTEKMLLHVESATSGLYLTGIPDVSTFSDLDKGCARIPGNPYKQWANEHGDIDQIELLPNYFDVTTPVETVVGTDQTFASINDSCTIPLAQRVTKISQISNAFSVNSKAVTMLVDLKPMVYDSTEFTLDKIEAKVKVSITKKPCGTIWSDTVKLGTFTKACTEVGSTLSLFFPYFPGMEEDWWSGLVLTNGSDTAGDATLTLIDEAGNSAYFKSGVIPAGGQKVILLSSDIELTPVKGVFDKTKKFSIKASTEFSMAAGLVVFGNGLDGQGVYKPYLGSEF